MIHLRIIFPGGGSIYASVDETDNDPEIAGVPLPVKNGETVLIFSHHKSYAIIDENGSNFREVKI